MRCLSIFTIGLILLAFGAGTPLQAAEGAAADEAKVVVMNGHYTWGKREKPEQTLKCTFTAAGEGKWTVVFDFPWKGKPHTYTGEVTGDLSEGAKGAIEGTAQNGGGKRTWKISGNLADGTLTCKHWETSKGGEKYTGTFTVSVDDKES